MANSSHTALVTGGAKRVGRAIVERLLEAGFNVAFTYRGSQADADELAKAHGDRALPIRVDLAEPEAAIATIRESLAKFSDRLDVLVNNASIYVPASLEESTPALLRKFMAIHVETPMLLAQAFAKQLRASRGSIVNMIDLLAERPWPKYLAYSASKAALANLTLGLARELAPEVRVNGIAPGVVEWPEGFPKAEQDKYLQRVPLARSGSPREVAELVHFLCAKDQYITGQIIRLDGGRSLT